MAIALGVWSASAQVATQAVVLPKPPAAAPAGQPISPPVQVPRPPINPVQGVPQPVVAPPPPAPPQPPPSPDSFLKWDAETKEIKAKVGEKPAAEFTFSFTNISSGDVMINAVQPSCGCTTVQLPPMPWKVAPGTNGEIPVRMTLTPVPNIYTKSVNVFTDKGMKTLIIRAVVEAAAAPANMTEADRQRNQEAAKLDPQAIFKNDCVKCHVEPAKDKLGKELYTVACGICHEAEHRASIVPSLHALNHDTNAEFWHATITSGKPNTLMPGFAQSHGGPLNDVQIASLVSYLVATMPAKAVTTNPPPPAPHPGSAGK